MKVYIEDIYLDCYLKGILGPKAPCLKQTRIVKYTASKVSSKLSKDIFKCSLLLFI